MYVYIYICMYIYIYIYKWRYSIDPTGFTTVNGMHPPSMEVSIMGIPPNHPSGVVKSDESNDCNYLNGGHQSLMYI